MKTIKRANLTPLQRVIRTRESAIKRMCERKAFVLRQAAHEAEDIQRRIDRQKVVLDAIKRGELKP